MEVDGRDRTPRLLRMGNRQVPLVETDAAYPDVGKACQKAVRSFSLVNLDENDDWLRLLDIVDASKDDKVVVNTIASNNEGVNRFFGMTPSLFELCDNSPLRVEVRQGLSLFLRQLATRVTNFVQSNRLTLERARETATLGNRAEIERWHRECAHNIFDKVCDDAPSK